MASSTNSNNKDFTATEPRCEDPVGDCCVITRAELFCLRANQARPDRRLVTLVTGGRKGGTGHATGMLLALSGHTVIVVEKDREAGQEAVRDIREHGGDAWFANLDASDEKGVQRLMEVIGRRWGRLDAAINNAGWAGDSKRDNFLALDADGFRELLDANLVSAFVVTRAALRSFFLRQPEGGTCIYLGSGEGQPGVGGAQVGYAAGKSALGALLQVATTQHGRAGCRFVLVRPGLLETNSRGWQERRKKDRHYALKEKEKIPLGRHGRPDEIAAVIAFLLRPEAAYINGAEINVDGGYLASGNLLPGQASTDRDAYVDLVNLVNEATTTRKAA